MSRCRDDFWLWAAVAAAASSQDAQPPCSCHRDRDEREPSNEELAALSERARVDAAARRKHYLAVLACILGLTALIAWVINSPSTPNGVTSAQPALSDLTPVAADAEPHDVTPPPVTVADAEPAIPMAAPPSAEPPPLPAESIVSEAAALSVVTPEQAPAALNAACFEVGSSRAEVLAAQGRPPTYSAHHNRMLWWGSSRVEFDAGGNVRSWENGTPPLQVR